MKLFDLDKLLNTLTGYIETKVELLKLDAKEELESLIGKLIVFFIIAICFLLAISLVSFGLAAILNNFLDSAYLGYMILGVVYMVLGLIVYQKKDGMMAKFKERSRREQNVNKDTDSQNV